MKRRNFTILSGLAVPAAILPAKNLLEGFYAKMSMQELQAPIAAHLKAFKLDLTKGLKAHQQKTNTADPMFQPKKIVSLRFSNPKNYHFSYINQAGNTVTLKNDKGLQKTIIA